MMHEITRHARHYSVAVVALVFIVAVTVTSIFVSHRVMAAAPIVSGTVSSSEIIKLDKRITQLERRQGNGVLVDIIQRLDKLQREVQQIIGNVEVQTHHVKTMKKRQRDLYLDIDRRLSKLEKFVKENKNQLSSMQSNPVVLMGGNMPITSTTLNTPVNTQRNIPSSGSRFNSVSPKLEIDAYERAFNQLKNGRYDVAVASFQAFLETFPTAKYAVNAQYWLGEANYVQRKYKVALKEFQKVIDNYPQSPKLPDALLKMGYSSYELGDKKAAIKLLEKIIKQYPATTSARLAKKRLISIKSGG